MAVRTFDIPEANEGNPVAPGPKYVRGYLWPTGKGMRVQSITGSTWRTECDADAGQSETNCNDLAGKPDVMEV